MTDALDLLSDLKIEVDSLAAKLGTIAPPLHPDEIIDTPGLSGPMWNAIDRANRGSVSYPWRVRAIDDEPGHYIYVHHPKSFDPSDFECLTVPEARRLAQVLLAACEYVDSEELAQRRVRRSVQKEKSGA